MRSGLFLILDSDERNEDGDFIVGDGRPTQIVRVYNPYPFPVSCKAVLTLTDGTPLSGLLYVFTAPTSGQTCVTPYTVDPFNSSQANLTLPGGACSGLSFDYVDTGHGPPDAPKVVEGKLLLVNAGGWIYASGGLSRR